MPENVNTSVLGESVADKRDDREVMIDVEHVSMVFNMASERLNSLKEYAIALAKRNLFFEEFTALDDVSFQVKRGDVYGIMGTNGSGKSTMLKIIAGVLDPTKGSCQVNGKIAPLIELGAGFDMDLTARENIYLNGALLGYSKEFIEENFEAIVEFAEIRKFLDMPLKNYSSGMVARIAFAIATVIVPDILLVDEVLSVGDFMFQRKCENRIKELIEKHGVTVLIVSHSNEQIARLCNKAIWIEKGHVRLQGSAETVTRIYSGLGGRTGSAESEQLVLDALRASLDEPIAGKASTVIGAENANSMSLKIATRLFGERPCETAVIACSNSHVNALTANALAAEHESPILTSGCDQLSDNAYVFLEAHRPSRIFLFDCGHYAQAVQDALQELPWKPTVIAFNEKKSLHEYCLSVYRYGRENYGWDSRVAFASFIDNFECLAAAPLLYHAKLPVILAADNVLESALNSLGQEGISEYIPIGQRVQQFVDKADMGITALGASAGSKSGFVDFHEIAAATIEAFSRQGQITNIALSSAAEAQWPMLLSCGPLCAMENRPLLLIDPRNLDSTARHLQLVRQLGATDALFIGGSAGLSESERRMFTQQLVRPTAE